MSALSVFPRRKSAPEHCLNTEYEKPIPLFISQKEDAEKLKIPAPFFFFETRDPLGALALNDVRDMLVTRVLKFQQDFIREV